MSADPRSLGRLLSDAIMQFSALLGSEVRLAKAEASEKATQAAVAVGLLVGAGVLLIPAFILALMALAAWLVELGLRASLAHLIAATVGLAISATLGFIGKSRLSIESLTPHNIAREMERDIDAAKRIL
jgi:uncharacterized membrane protein YqjE